MRINGVGEFVVKEEYYFTLLYYCADVRFLYSLLLVMIRVLQNGGRLYCL